MRTIKELGESDIGEMAREYFEKRGQKLVGFTVQVNQGDPGHPCDRGPSVSARAWIEEGEGSKPQVEPGQLVPWLAGTCPTCGAAPDKPCQFAGGEPGNPFGCAG